MDKSIVLSRRTFLGAASVGTMGVAATLAAADRPKAHIAISLDLEMSPGFPTDKDTEWEFEKGNLDEATKQYTVEACRRIKAADGLAHCFVVGRVLEQPNVQWLKDIAAAGHALGNHTYDHVFVLAKTVAEVQARFKRAPWLTAGKSVTNLLRDNIQMTTAAMRDRLGIQPRGFRTPGGFPDGLKDRADLQKLLLDLGFKWASSKYGFHKLNEAGRPVTPEIFDSVEAIQEKCQPFAYPTGLIEVPMSPTSDIMAFRFGKWKLDQWLQALRRGVEWAIEHRAVFDFLGHPSCLHVMDPKFRGIDLVLELVNKSRDKAKIVDLDAIAARVR